MLGRAVNLGHKSIASCRNDIDIVRDNIRLVKTGDCSTSLSHSSVFFSLATGLLPQLNSSVEGEFFLKQSVNKAFIDLGAPCAGGGRAEWSSEGDICSRRC